MSDGPNVSVRRFLDRAVRAGFAPGFVAGWQRLDADHPTIVAAGRAAVIPKSAPIAPDTWFDLASLTKPLVITPLVMLQIRNGDLSLESSAAEVIPELDGVELGRRRLRHLLTHTSGLPAWEPVYSLASGPDHRPVVRALGELDLEEPGRKVVYSCPGFILLGIILSRLTGTSLDILYRRLVLEPLGLTTELGYDPGPNRPLASGALSPGTERDLLRERGLDPSSIPKIEPGLPDDGNARFQAGVSGNAGLFGTARGVLALALEFLAPGRLLTSDEIAQATRIHTPGLEQSRGLGWQLASTPGCSAGPALSPSSFGHNGFTGTSLWVDPANEVAMVLLSNRVHPGHRPTELHPLRRRFHQLVLMSACRHQGGIRY